MIDISISQDKSMLDVDMISHFLSTAYWSKDRTISMIQSTIENSICFGVYKAGEQIGFARVVSDKVVFAYIMDVFILENHRGNGYGKELMNHIITTPDLKAVQNWLLGTSDAHELYKKFGFNALKHPQKMMEKKLI